MKKVVVAVATACAVAVTAVGVAFAGSGPTVVATGFTCGIFDGNGNIVTTNNSILLLYSSGKAVLQCEDNVAPAPSLTYYNFGNTGVTCGMLQFGSTTTWSNKVGYNGNSQLTCTTFVQDSIDSASAGGAGIG